MFNDYEIFYLSKIKREEMVKVTKLHLDTKQNNKNNWLAKIGKKPIKAICCEPACC